MKKLYPSIFLAAIVISAIAATVKISDLPISTSPSTNTFIEIADMNAVTKSSKYLLTNLVTVAQGQASTNALTNTFVLKAGDSMSGALTGPSSTWTNGITAGASTLTSYLTFRPTVTNGTQGAWTVSGGTGVTNNADGTYDEVWNLGFNYSAFGGGGQINTNLHALKLGFESNFKQAGTNYLEWNMDFWKASGANNRPFSTGIDILTGTPMWNFAGSEFRFVGGNSAGNLNPTIWSMSDTAHASQFAFNGTVSASSVMTTPHITMTSNEWYNTAIFPFVLPLDTASAKWTNTTFTIGTETQRPLQLHVGTNAVMDFSNTGNDLDAYASLVTFGKGRSSTDVHIKSTDGSIYLDAGSLGGAKGIRFTPTSTAYVQVDNSGLFSVGKGTVNGRIIIQGGGANEFCVAAGSATTILTSVGQGAFNATYGGYTKWDTNGTTTFIGTNSTQVASLGASGGLTLSGNVNFQGGVTKVLTDATATSAFYLSVPNTNALGGEVLWTVSATDGTDTQQQTGRTQFGAVGKSTTVTADLTTRTNAAQVSAGTLTVDVIKNVATNNVFALQFNADTSLTTTNLVLKWRLETPSTYTVNSL